MDSEKSTLSDVHSSEHEAEYTEVLTELREAVFRRRPADVYQFCAQHFQQKLAEQRAGLLELVKMHPGILDSSAPATAVAASSAAPAESSGSESRAAGVATSTGSMHQDEAPQESGPEADDGSDGPHVRMRHASEHAWSSGGGDGHGAADGVYGMINPAFSFGGPAAAADGEGSGMTVDDDDESAEARDKFSSLVSVGAGGMAAFAGRRFSVSAESMKPSTDAEYRKKFVAKTSAQKQRIRQALDGNFLFKNIDEDSYRDVVDAMEEKHVAQGQSVIVQGGVGDYFYIVERGTFDIHVRKEGGSGEAEKVMEVGDGGSFGELALMYNAPRAATVTATSAATLWALDRITFRSLLMERTSRKRRLYERFLETVPLLRSLEAYERQKIADALESVTYGDGDTIVRQGEPGDDFFLIEQGVVRVYKSEDGGAADDEGERREYPALGPGDYFGELALLDNQPRAATLVSCGRTKCARMTRNAFNRLLGPVINIIRREAGNYPHIPSLSSAA
ncbi:hypothetical protein GGI15_001642 [Coemansia interrupta]|uniref:cAMP-dependent protein kinase regulatory subunit n=1 Tax=Coemansia interrupta TaxID=1126814 RepID=A0A9W8LNF3_9FUNG|nr:hypothetical protein GGI15_001642 [Coemansia interrupta]